MTCMISKKNSKVGIWFQRTISLILLMASASIFFSGCTLVPDGQGNEAKSTASVSASASTSALTSVSTSASNQQTVTESKIFQDLSSYLDRLSTEDKFSGVVLLAKDGVPLFEQAYGYANHAFNASNNLETKFNMASVGKMFTAVAIMQLIQEGKISLDNKLIELIPDYPNKEVASKITVQQLLTHTSGLGNIFTDEYEKSDQSKFRTLESYLSLFANEPLQFEPGEKYEYSNAGFVVLGLIIENITGEDYYQYINKKIFEPAEMVDTGFYSVYDDVPNLALGYTSRITYQIPGKVDESKGNSRKVAPHLEPGTSAGGVYSTVADMLKFSEALQDNKLIDEERVDLLFSGNGIVYTQENGVRIVGHSGGNNGVSTNIDIYPDLGYTAIILSNYDEGPKLFNQRLRWQLTGNDIPQTIELSDADLKAFEGQYKSEAPASGERKNMMIMGPSGSEPPKEMPITITAAGNGLQVSLRGSIYYFVPVSDTEYYDYADPRSRLTFTKDGSGQVTGLSVEGGQIREKAAKQD